MTGEDACVWAMSHLLRFGDLIPEGGGLRINNEEGTEVSMPEDVMERLREIAAEAAEQ